MSVTRRFVIAALSMLCLHGVASAELSASSPRPQIPTAVIRLSGEVDDFRRDTLFRHFRQAEAAGAQTIILEIDTYGGMVTSALDMTTFLRGQTKIHTIAYVNKKAISAGSMIAMACDEIIMAPNATIGDCAPITVDASGNLKPLPVAERAKLQSPIIADFTESARRNGYNQTVVEAMVRPELSIYLVQDGKGHERIVDESEYKTLTDAGWKLASDLVPNPIDGPDTLLTIGAIPAKRLGISKGTSNSIQDLCSERGLNIVADLSPGIGDQMVELLNNASARFLLIVIFLLSLYICLHAPGHGAAEAVAIISLGLLVCVPMLTGYAQWWEVAMIFIGLALCAFELLVFPGHGLSLGIGILMVLGGLLFTFVGKDVGPGWLPHSPDAWLRLRLGVKVVCGAVVAAVVCGSVIRPFLPKLPIFRRLVLAETSGPPIASAGTPLKAGEDVWPFVGTIGVAVTDLRPGGIVQFPYGADSRNADVMGVGGYLSAGTKVVVQEARGNRITVRPM